LEISPLSFLNKEELISKTFSLIIHESNRKLIFGQLPYDSLKIKALIKITYLAITNTISSAKSNISEKKRSENNIKKELEQDISKNLFAIKRKNNLSITDKKKVFNQKKLAIKSVYSEEKEVQKVDALGSIKSKDLSINLVINNKISFRPT